MMIVVRRQVPKRENTTLPDRDKLSEAFNIHEMRTSIYGVKRQKNVGRYIPKF